MRTEGLGFRLAVIIPVMLLALYPLFELTRYIVRFNLLGQWSKDFSASYAELVFMWIFYLLIPVWLNHILGRILK